MSSGQATVKSVLSADTIVLRGKAAAAGQIPKERVLHLAGLTAGRVGNRDRPDEPFAFEGREFLRALLVGKQVLFNVSHTISSTTPPLEFGTVTAKSSSGEDIDVATAVVTAGWAKVRESRGNADEEDGAKREALVAAEDEAKTMARGLWSTAPPPERQVSFVMPEDPAAFLAKYKSQPLDAVIEAVPSGSSVRARLLLSPTQHQFVNVGIAGIRAPRAGGDGAEEFGDEARFFAESRLLQRQIKVTLLALPTPQGAPVAFNANGQDSAAPAPVASTFLGTIHHPAGNIAALVLSTGLAKVVDWHAGFLSQSPTPTMMQELRKAEAEAKAGRRCLWRNLPEPTQAGQAAAAQQEKERRYDAVVTRVWGADQLSVLRADGKEVRIQLASTRQPKPTDPKLAGLQAEGKELLRKKLIGKTVHVTIDYVKPAEAGFEARECATVTTTNGNNVAELLAERGLLSIIRHRQGDEQRSSDYDKLMAAEAKAIAELKGVHSGKDFPLGRIIDASETAQKAAPFLSSFKRAGRVSGIVDFVASGSRFKIFVPKQDTKLTLVLSGIRCPRTARNVNEKSEPYGDEAASFISRKALQRDVEFVVETTDKSGGFIGNLYVNGQDVAVMLLKEGLAKADDYCQSKELLSAQEMAQKEGKNIWKGYDAEAEARKNGNGPAVVPVKRTEYVDLIVSDIKGGKDTEPFSFAVQILGQNGTIPELERLMSDLTVFHKDATVTPAGFVPRMNDLVSAKFTADDQWYRARIRRTNPARKEADVVYIDYGNSEIIPFDRLRPLAQQFKILAPQAHEAKLSFVTLIGNELPEYGAEALERFRELTEGRQLVANIDSRDATSLQLSLFDPDSPESLSSHASSLNVELVKEGWARIAKGSPLRQVYPEVVKALDAAAQEARRSRAGVYDFGDLLDD